MRDKGESSMPVQSRIDLVVLAELSEYWRDSGYVIDNMSRLVSWSLTAFHSLLKNNKKINVDVKTLEDAYYVLSTKGLIQKSMQKRMEKKLMTARGLENIRLDGWELDQTLPQYQKMHKIDSVVPGPEFTAISKRDIQKQVEVYEEIERQERMNKSKDQTEEAFKGPNVVKVKDEAVVNVEKNIAKAQENDEKLKDM